MTNLLLAFALLVSTSKILAYPASTVSFPIDEANYTHGHQNLPQFGQNVCCPQQKKHVDSGIKSGAGALEEYDRNSKEGNLVRFNLA